MSSPDWQRREPRPRPVRLSASRDHDRLLTPRYSRRLPSAPDDKRKRMVVDYALQTRRQLLKLLVLVRWSERAQGITKSMVSARPVVVLRGHVERAG